MGDLWYLALAYGVIWLGLLAYLFRLARRAEGLSRELGLLKQILIAGQDPEDAGESQSVSSSAGGRSGDVGLPGEQTPMQPV